MVAVCTRGNFFSTYPVRYSGEDGGEESVSVFAMCTVLLLESNCAWPSNELIQQFSSRAESALDMYVAMCG